MSSPRVALPLAGNVMGASDDGFMIAEWRDAGGPPGPPRLIAPLHLHRHDDEAWYVLEGTLIVQSGPDRDRDQVEVPAGSGIFVPRGTPHTYWNPGPEPVRYLLVMTSNIYRLIQDIHALTEKTPEQLKAVFARHDSELL
jgi:mannose-6-phosphate isomerase-like protein (cupin superfamily)